ncbi:MAG: hypothetical protein Q9182_002776 [Xanthomendoza sp. 2 TL-2023]
MAHLDASPIPIQAPLTAPIKDSDIFAATLPMWLINVHTLGLEEFWDENETKYAILSHRWEYKSAVICYVFLSDFDGPASDLATIEDSQRLDEDDQYARVKYEGQTLISRDARSWDPLHFGYFGNFANWSFVKESYGMIQKPSYIQVNVRQGNIDPLENVFKPRLDGFSIASEGCLQRSNACDLPFQVLGCEWRSYEYIMQSYSRNLFKVGDIVLAGKSHNIKFVHLGFDFEYNPVCVLATADRMRYMIESHPYLESNCYGFYDEQTLFDRAFYDQLQWSDVSVNENVQQSTTYPGLWAIKGDRLNGLRASLRKSDGMLAPGKAITSISIDRVELDHKLA